jgi:hypothetical protein
VHTVQGRIELPLDTLTNAFRQRCRGAQTMESMDCGSRLQGKCSKPAVTHSVTPFRQNRARSALFFARDESTALGSLQQSDKTVLICKEEASKNLGWQAKCSKSNAINVFPECNEGGSNEEEFTRIFTD